MRTLEPEKVNEVDVQLSKTEHLGALSGYGDFVDSVFIFFVKECDFWGSNNTSGLCALLGWLFSFFLSHDSVCLFIVFGLPVSSLRIPFWLVGCFLFTVKLPDKMELVMEMTEQFCNKKQTELRTGACGRFLSQKIEQGTTYLKYMKSQNCYWCYSFLDENQIWLSLLNIYTWSCSSACTSSV